MPISKERLAEIEAIPESEIDTSDIPEMDEKFFAAARLVMPLAASVSVRYPSFTDQELVEGGPVSQSNFAKAKSFYEERYDLLLDLRLKPRSKKKFLGAKQNLRCRFCGQGPPRTTFKKAAHAIPESLGNKSIFVNHECDACNEFFGKGIENDFGNWSKPSRTFSRIRGKKGVPKIKKIGTDPGWRIEYGPQGFHVKVYEDDPPFSIDETARRITFELTRDLYTPVAVLKALVRMGLTLLPEEEIVYFPEALAWVREPDHTKSPMREFPVLSTFLPGPMPNDLIVVRLLRRKSRVIGVPYAFLILGYGNETFQICLPSLSQDRDIIGKEFTLPFYLLYDDSKSPNYPEARRRLLDLTGQEPVKDEPCQIQMNYDHADVQESTLSK